MVISKQKIKAKYQSGAKYYDLYVWLYRLIGFHIEAYRSRAIELLHLQQRDCAVATAVGPAGIRAPSTIHFGG